MGKPMTFNEWMGTLGNNALVHANCCRKAYEAGQQHQQAKVEELQKRVDATLDALIELKETSRALHHRWGIFNDSSALVEAEMIDMCVNVLEQALKGEG